MTSTSSGQYIKSSLFLYFSYLLFPVSTEPVTSTEDPLAFLSQEERDFFFQMPPAEREIFLTALSTQTEQGGDNKTALNSLQALALELQSIKFPTGESQQNNSDSPPSGRSSDERGTGLIDSTATSNLPSTSSEDTTTERSFSVSVFFSQSSPRYRHVTSVILYQCSIP